MPPSMPLWPRLAPATQSAMPTTCTLAIRSRTPRCQPALLTTKSSSRPTVPTTTRLFATTSTQSYKQRRVPSSTLPIPAPRAPSESSIPPYPPGPAQVYKQSNIGLYGGLRIRFGNNISSDHNVRTRRSWRPNIRSKNLWSEALGTHVRTRVAARVLRTIDKLGGLDEYLLGSKPARVAELGPWGWKLRWRIMQTEKVQERFAREREALGLPPRPEGDGMEDAPPEVVAEGVTNEGLMRETDRMLVQGDEFAIGEVAEKDVEEGEFMREEKPELAR